MRPRVPFPLPERLILGLQGELPDEVEPIRANEEPTNARASSRRRVRCAVLTLSLLAALAVPATALGDAATVTFTEPFVFTGPNPCTGEQVTVEGHNHTVLHMQLDSSGGLHFLTITVDFHGTGFNVLNPENKYSVADRQFLELNFPDPTAEATVDFRTRVVRVGETSLVRDDFFLRLQLHVTRNANGIFTAFFLRPSTECR